MFIRGPVDYHKSNSNVKPNYREIADHFFAAFPEYANRNITSDDLSEFNHYS